MKHTASRLLASHPHAFKETELLQAWKHATQEGINASHAQCQAHALFWHQKALQIAHQLMHDQAISPHAQRLDKAADDALNPVSVDDKLAALVVAHLNLGDCYADLRELDNAADCMSCAHHQLLQLTGDEAAPDCWRMAAYRHLRETHAALQLFCSQYGEHPKVMHALNRQTLDPQTHFLSTQLH